MYFPEFKRNPILYSSMYTCKICKTLLTDAICYMSISSGILSKFNICSEFTDCIGLCIPLHFPMHSSGRHRLFVKNFGVVLREE